MGVFCFEVEVHETLLRIESCESEIGNIENWVDSDAGKKTSERLRNDIFATMKRSVSD
jgi:hypothetical protein